MMRAVAAATLLLALAACGWMSGASAPAKPIPRELAGTVVFREPIGLLPDTQLRVRLEETSGGDKPPQFIAETIIPQVGHSPIAFRIALAPGVIDLGRIYTLTARIERDDRLLFVNEVPVRVLTGGNPAWVEILVTPPASGRPKPGADASLSSKPG